MKSFYEIVSLLKTFMKRKVIKVNVNVNVFFIVNVNQTYQYLTRIDQ